MKRRKPISRLTIQLRYATVEAVILVLTGWIVYHLVDTTVTHREQWMDKAMSAFEHVDTILPERGDILASDGSILATNLRYYTVRIDFRSELFMENRYVAALDSIADSMAVHFPRLDRQQWLDSLKKPLRLPVAERSHGWPLITRINYAQLQRLRTFPFFNIKNPNRNGLITESKMRRSRPYGEMARRSIGGVGETRKCKEIHGISGIEKALDSLLYGQIGYAKRVPLTRSVVNWTDIPPRNGYTLRTTIDIGLQDIVETELNRMLDTVDATWGCALLMEVKTGDIVAISNLEKSKTGKGYVEALNYAVVGFEPGSVVKPISMMVALEDGLVNNLEEVIPIGARWAYAGGKPITDSHVSIALKVREVIEQSSNIGMARIVTRGYDSKPAAWVERLASIGFLEPMNTGIAGERTPYFKKKPARVDLARMAYGYTSQIPPLYTMAMYNAMANDGRFVRPRLVKEWIGEDFDSVIPVTYVRDRVCSEENARKMQYMLRMVVDGPHGTGRRLKNDKVAIAGKTGTCYSVDPVTHRYNTARKRLAFCGFFPADKPMYTCMVLTFHPKKNAFGAASTSGQALKNIALKMYARGLLDNHSDYASEEGKQTDAQNPQLYGTLKPATRSAVKQAAHLKGERKPMQPPATAAGTVPSVRGLSLREAVATLEAQGYEVKAQGSGYVRAQSPHEGTQVPKGSLVTLSLTP